MTTGRIPSVDGGIQPTIIDAAGDLIYGASNDTPARLAIGTAGQVLRVNSGATAPEWFSPTLPSETTFTLLNAGGTALSGSQTVTISSIGGYDAYFVLIRAASSANASSELSIRPNNSSTGTDYIYGFNYNSVTSTYDTGGTFTGGGVTTGAGLGNFASSIPIARQAANASAEMGGSLMLWGGKETGLKSFIAVGGGAAWTPSGQDNILTTVNGLFNCSSTITSMVIRSSTGNFDAGTVFVYGGTI